MNIKEKNERMSVHLSILTFIRTFGCASFDDFIDLIFLQKNIFPIYVYISQILIVYLNGNNLKIIIKK